VATLNDGVMSRLSAFTGTANDKISAWLRSLLSPAAPATATLDDLWLILANQYGYVDGTTQEKIAAAMNAALAGQGLTTYNDIQRAFWNSASDIPVAGYIFNFDTLLLDLPENLTALGATFARPTVKNVVQDGMVVELAADQFGTHYDVVTGQYAYWPESVAVNIVTQSEVFTGAPWSWVGSTISPNAATAPNGLVTADILAETTDGAPAAHYIVASPATIGADNTFSVFVKAVYRSQVGLQLGGIITVYELSGAGSIVSGSGKIEIVGNGWYRCSVSRTAVADANVAIYSAVGGNVTYLGSGLNAIAIWGAQVEETLICSSYIKTAGATATRDADSLLISTSGMPDFDTSGYSLSFDCRMPSGTVTYGSFMGLTDGSADNAIMIFSLSDTIGNVVYSATVEQSNIAEGATGTSDFSFAASYSANSFLRSFNGATGTSDTSCAMPIGVDSLYIGYGIANLDGYIFNAGFYMNPKTQDELNTLTS